MTFYLRNKIALATVPAEESTRSHKPSTELLHNRPSRHGPI